jgi:hypothetical protein
MRVARIVLALLETSIVLHSTWSFQLIPQKVSFAQPYNGIGWKSITTKKRRFSSKLAAVTSVTPRIHVSLDEPLLALKNELGPTTTLAATGAMKRANFPGKIATIATICLVLFFINWASKSENVAGDDLLQKIFHVYKLARGKITRIVEETIDNVKPTKEYTPMPFDEVDGGWGTCTLSETERHGSTSFLQFTFDLPSQDYVLPLELGQTISLCCLDDNDTVIQAEFFPFQLHRSIQPGTFSILVPDPESSLTSSILRDDEFLERQIVFARVIQGLKVGDEVALQPGSHRLYYEGPPVPVTNIVYVAVGTGIVPVLDQLRTVLPNSSLTSVQSATVVWINTEPDDFDIIADVLEKEYYKYSRKLSVSCFANDLMTPLSENEDFNNAPISSFQAGTIAVLSGPSQTISKAASFLKEQRGFPGDCICVL